MRVKTTQQLASRIAKSQRKDFFTDRKDFPSAPMSSSLDPSILDTEPLNLLPRVLHEKKVICGISDKETKVWADVPLEILRGDMELNLGDLVGRPRNPHSSWIMAQTLELQLEIRVPKYDAEPFIRCEATISPTEPLEVSVSSKRVLYQGHALVKAFSRQVSEFELCLHRAKTKKQEDQ